jgi:fructuronate reductase
VSREAYSEWIVEDVLPEGSPDLASVGVRMARDVADWERAKLRILNGAHSSLAYLGLLIGHVTVADTMADAPLSSFVERLIAEDIIPSLRPSTLDLDSYATDILGRFGNPAIGHRLSQIAWDGSQKLPYRLLDTVADALAAGRSVERLAVPVAAWILFIERQAAGRAEIVDPLAGRLAEIGRGPDSIDGLLALRQVFPEKLAANERFRGAVRRAAERIRNAGPRAAVTEELADA